MLDPEVDLDIFGYPVLPPTERRGRPRHVATSESRDVVALLAALDKTHAEICETLAISEPTLRKNYRAELSHGRAQIRAEVMFRAMEQVRAGNVSAMALVLRRLDAADLAALHRRVADHDRPAPAPGKKEQQAEAARAAGGSGRYATPSPPKLVVDNRD